MNRLKEQVAEAALKYIEDDMLIGVGSGSTVGFFIQALSTVKNKINAAVASSKQTEALLKALHIPVLELNSVSELDLYVDGADEVNAIGEMIKGGGGALTREKILATASKKFVCIVDETKVVKQFAHFPIAIEVIPMARSFVARQLVKLGGDPEYREGFVTDNGNIILDLYNLPILTPLQMESTLKSIPGVVENGIFAHRKADTVLVAKENGIYTLF